MHFCRSNRILWPEALIICPGSCCHVLGHPPPSSSPCMHHTGTCSSSMRHHHNHHETSPHDIVVIKLLCPILFAIVIIISSSPRHHQANGSSEQHSAAWEAFLHRLDSVQVNDVAMKSSLQVLNARANYCPMPIVFCIVPMHTCGATYIIDTLMKHSHISLA